MIENQLFVNKLVEFLLLPPNPLKGESAAAKS